MTSTVIALTYLTYCSHNPEPVSVSKGSGNTPTPHFAYLGLHQVLQIGLEAEMLSYREKSGRPDETTHA